jgi:hypothetical protein
MKATQPSGTITEADVKKFVLMFVELNHPDLYQEVTQKRPYTCVKLGLLNTQGVMRTGIGFSKVMTGDTWDANVGVEMATKRAARSLARAIWRQETRLQHESS